MEPIQEGLFEIHDDNTGYLLINRCDQCGLNFYPRRMSCIKCFREDKLVDCVLRKNGKLYTFAIVYRARPQYETPYVIGYIDFEEEGIRIFGQISGFNNPKEIKIGMEMGLFFEEMKMKDESKKKIVCKFRPVIRD